jgi:hypothetical protein
MPVLWAGIFPSESLSMKTLNQNVPCRNVTGMLEVSLIPQILDTVRPLAKGTRIAMLGNDNETDRMEGRMIPQRFGVHWCAEHYVKTFEEWKTVYKELQTATDIIFWYGLVGIKDWSDEEAKAIVLQETRVITCSSQYYMAEFVLVGIGRAHHRVDRPCQGGGRGKMS